jgi:Tol biopolymer transport system component
MRTGLAIAAALLAGVASGCGVKPASQESASIVYAVGPESGWKVSGLYLAGADGNRHTRLTSDSLPRATYARWSPVGDSILVESWLPRNGDVWTINADGTGVRRIAGGVGASWSPDGREIAVVKDGGKIEILSSEGVHLRTIDLGIPRDNAVDQAPAWSQDGQVLALQDRGDGVLYVAPADGKGDSRPVVTGLADLVYEVNPAWSPDGKRLAFTREAPDTDDAWTSRPDGSDLRLVARDVDVLTWSADGEALIGESIDDLRTYRYPVDGGEPRLLSEAEEGRAVARGRISPDGKRMVAALDSGRLVVTRLDGSDPTELTRPVTDSSPVWSPDGAEIAFLRASGSSEGESDMYLIRANGKGERQIGSPSAVGSLEWWGPIEWSPDGTALLGQTGPEGSIETTVMSVATGQVRRLPGAWKSAWSPDGAKIALVVDRFPGRPGGAESRSTLYSVRRDGTGWRRLAEVRSDGFEHAVVFSLPVWMPDQEAIVVGEYDHAEESPARIRQIPVSGGRDRTIVQDASGKFPGWVVSPDGKQLAFMS